MTGQAPGRAAREAQAQPWDSGETVSPDPSWPVERQLRWYQTASHILLLNCSEVTRRKAAAAADREATPAIAAQERPAPGTWTVAECLERIGVLAGALHEIKSVYTPGTMAHDTAHAALDHAAPPAQERPAPDGDARRALLDIIAEVDQLDEGGPTADWIRMLAEHGLGETSHPDAVVAAQERPAPGDDDLRAALESLAAFWVREYVTNDGWPDVCAKQLLDVLGGAREPKAAPSAAPELAAAMAETRRYRDWLDEATRVMLNLGTRPAEVNLARKIRKEAGFAP